MNASQPVASETHLPARLFGGKHLPARLVVLVLLLIATNAAQVFMDLSPAYWFDLRGTGSDWLLPMLTSKGPWFFSAVLVLYMATVGLLLFHLKQSIALVAAGALILLHSYYLTTGSYCRIPPFGWFVDTDNCWLAFTVQRWLWTGLFVLTLTSLFPIPIRLPGRRWFSALAVVLAAGWFAVQVYGVIRSAVPSPNGWQVLAPEHSPTPRFSMGIAYDTARQRAVLFGGEGMDQYYQYVLFNDTWEWDGVDWTQIHTENVPPARRVPSIAYDERRGVIVLYGGSNHSGNLSDVWEYDGTNWVERCPYCTPTARWGAAMLYDPELQKVVLYGGVSNGEGDEPDKWHTEAWAWDGSTWEYTGIDTAAPAAFEPGLVYDPDQQRRLAFLNLDYGGTWIWDDHKWTKAEMDIQPPRAGGASMIYDPQYRRIVLYGGQQNPGNRLFNQTWVYDGASWQQVTSPRSPMPRKNQDGFFDPSRQSMIIFGGLGINDKPLDDMWELPLSAPTAGQPGGGIP